MMKYILVYVMCLITFIGCTPEVKTDNKIAFGTTELDTEQDTEQAIGQVTIKTSSVKLPISLAQKIASLIKHTPNEWERHYIYNRDCRYEKLTHVSGVVITMTRRRGSTSTKWGDATSEGWNISKPKGVKLTVEESRILDDAYYGWYELDNKDTRQLVSDVLNNY